MADKLEVPRLRDLDGGSVSKASPNARMTGARTVEERPGRNAVAGGRGSSLPRSLADAIAKAWQRWIAPLSSYNKLRLAGAVITLPVFAVLWFRADGGRKIVAPEPLPRQQSELPAPVVPAGAHGPIPRNAPQYWVTPDDYPAAALREEAQGVTRLKATVSPEGRISACSVEAGSGHKELDAQSCYLVMSRGRFVPARDAAGADIEGTWRGAFRWELPED